MGSSSEELAVLVLRERQLVFGPMVIYPDSVLDGWVLCPSRAWMSGLPLAPLFPPPRPPRAAASPAAPHSAAARRPDAPRRHRAPRQASDPAHSRARSETRSEGEEGE